MKRILLWILSFTFFSYASAQFGIFASAAYISVNGTSQFYNNLDQQPDASAIGTINFQDADLGTYTQNSSALELQGGEVKTYKNTNGNVCSPVDMYYTIYPAGNRPANASFQLIGLNFYDNCSGTSFPTGGPCNPGDQKWQEVSQNIDLTTYIPGTYTLEIYYQANGTNDNNCGDSIVYDNNNTNPTNYTATFTISSTTPVVLQSFTATHYSNEVLLKWVDGQEIDSKGFEIERSTDGQNFSTIGSEVSDGNSSSTNAYTYADNNLPNVTEVFYRLKIINTDGSFKYSFVVPVNLSVFAVPLTVQVNDDNVIIHANGLTNGSYAVQLYSMDGKLINNNNLEIAGNNIAMQNIQITANNLSKGIYAVIVRDETGTVISKSSFIK